MNPKNTLCLIVDIQETPAARPFRRGRNVGTLPPVDSRLDGFGRTLAVTEQYPKGLGNTASAVSLLLPEGTPVVEKTRFSAFLPEIHEILRKNDIKTVILVGAEAHICMLQTALDLKAQGYTVFLPLNAHLAHNGQPRQWVGATEPSGHYHFQCRKYFVPTARRCQTSGL